MRTKLHPRPIGLVLAAFLVAAQAAPPFAGSPAAAEVLPKPTHANSLIVSIEHNPADAAEIDVIKSHIPFGLYAWLSLSLTGLSPALDWHTSWDDADRGIQAFKDQVDSYIAVAKAKETRLHLVLISGLARYWSVYREAKDEDVRNAQWYNDNKLCSDEQHSVSDFMSLSVYGTLSRYARKLRANLEAKSRATVAFLKLRMDENPDVIAAVSGWGEAELNQFRINHTKSIQDWFCDYSPFAVLEFRDWIQHAGMYDDTNGEFAKQGWTEGGTKYQGTAGLAAFNAKFGKSFKTWDLKYFHWSLADDWDQTPTDAENNDPHRIPVASYAHGKMMPTSGANYIAGGFDPPRVMGWPKGYAEHSDFWDLWNLFRETMVRHFVRDLAVWAHQAGIPPARWFTHQLPGDYLYGATPETPLKNPRYYTSASPLWTANVRPYGMPGATIYDIKFPAYFVRTTTLGVPALAKMASDWAILEYDPETYPTGLGVPQSPSSAILAQHMFVYSYRPHIINFFRWIDTIGEHQIKGMNKEKALRQFIGQVRDKARSTDLAAMFSPPKVIGLSGSGDARNGGYELKLSGRIWTDAKWEWKEWGDFLHFEIYRGTTADYPLDALHLIATSVGTVYRDGTAKAGQDYYYRVRAVNKNKVVGPASTALKMPSRTLTIGAGEGGTTNPAPGIYNYSVAKEVAVRALPFSGYHFLRWSGDATGSANPLILTVDVSKSVTANFEKDFVYPPLNFTGRKIANRSLAQIEYIIELTWEANPNAAAIRGYRLYGYDGGAMTFIAELDAGTFLYQRRRVVGNQNYLYGLTAVDPAGIESPQMTVNVQ
jgi:hypothetical protein